MAIKSAERLPPSLLVTRSPPDECDPAGKSPAIWVRCRCRHLRAELRATGCGSRPIIETVTRTDTASRVIPASREEIFAALTNADALTAWLPPEGMTGRFDHFEPRPGGTYRLILTYADASIGRGKTSAKTDIVEARFVDIVPGVRVVQAVDFVSEDPAYAGTMTMTWELTPVGDATCVEVRADHVPAGISAEDHSVGLRSSLAHLARYLER